MLDLDRTEDGNQRDRRFGVDQPGSGSGVDRRVEVVGVSLLTDGSRRDIDERTVGVLVDDPGWVAST
jgi:hypothetical protein